MFDLSLGIMAYNEEANIGRLLNTLLDDKPAHNTLKEIIVVASGCTDSTEAIVEQYVYRDSRIRLISQPERKGKASAVNLFLTDASGDILLLESADTIPEPGTLDRLVEPFQEPRVGMTGARPVPVNSRDTFIGFCVNLMWDLHHQISLITPKLGELVAFRNCVEAIPEDTAVDEASIEAIIRDAGLELRYVPGAAVLNKGPETVKDFLRQRRRIAVGHLHLMHREHYQVSTQNPGKIVRLLFRQQRRGVRERVWTLGAVLLEVLGRSLGYYDFRIRHRNHVVWDIAGTTKKLH